MGINKEIWSTLAEANLFAKTPLITVSNRQFEGDLRTGKTVNVYTYPLADTPDEVNYDGDTSVDFTKVKPGIVSLTVDQTKSFGMRVDDVDKIQNSPDTLEKFIENELEKKAVAIDSYLLNLCKTNITTNVLDYSTVKLTKDNIVEIIDEVNVALDEQSASKNRFIYLDPKSVSVLRQANLVNILKNENGIVGPKEIMMFGDNIEIISSSLVKPEAGVLTIVAGTKDLINFVSQINSLEYTRLAAVGLAADGVLGLYSYGAKIFNEKKGVKLLVKDYKSL